MVPTQEPKYADDERRRCLFCRPLIGWNVLFLVPTFKLSDDYHCAFCLFLKMFFLVPKIYVGGRGFWTLFYGRDGYRLKCGTMNNHTAAGGCLTKFVSSAIAQLLEARKLELESYSTALWVQVDEMLFKRKRTANDRRKTCERPFVVSSQQEHYIETNYESDSLIHSRNIFISASNWSNS